MAAAAHSTLDQGVNITLAVSLSSAGAEDGITVYPYTAMCLRRLKAIFSASKRISHLQGVELIVVSPQHPWKRGKFFHPHT